MKGCQALEESAQGGGGMPIPAGVQGRTGCGTQCSGLDDKVVLGHRLDSIISEFFSKLIDSGISVNHRDTTCGSGSGTTSVLHPTS